MSYIANQRFIASDGTEYQKDATINEENLDSDYLNALVKAGIAINSNGKKGAVTTPAPFHEVTTPAPVATTEAPAHASQAVDVGTITDILPDLVANRESSTGTGNFQAPVGSVSGEEVNTEPEGSAVGSVSGEEVNTGNETPVATVADVPEVTPVATVSGTETKPATPAVKKTPAKPATPAVKTAVK